MDTLKQPARPLLLSWSRCTSDLGKVLSVPESSRHASRRPAHDSKQQSSLANPQSSRERLRVMPRVGSEGRDEKWEVGRTW